MTVPGGQGLDRVIALFNAGLKGQAASAARDYLAGHPDDATALLILAACLQDDDPAQAADAARRCLAVNPDSASAWSIYGGILPKLNDRWGAVAAVSRAIELEPDNWHHQVQLADVTCPTNSRDAITAATRAVRLAPDEPIAYFCLGNAYFAAERWRDAAEQFEAALKIDPEMAEARHNLAMVKLRLGKTRHAVGLAAGVLRQRPDINESRRPFLVTQFRLINAILVWGMVVIAAALTLQLLWSHLTSHNLVIVVAVGVACLGSLAAIVAVVRRRLSALSWPAAWRLVTGAWWSRLLLSLSLTLPLVLLALAFTWHNTASLVLTGVALMAQMVGWTAVIPWVARKLVAQAGLKPSQRAAARVPLDTGRPGPLAVLLVALALVVGFGVVENHGGGPTRPTIPISPSWFPQITSAPIQPVTPVDLHFGQAYALADLVSVRVMAPEPFTPSDGADGTMADRASVEIYLDSGPLSDRPPVAVLFRATVMSGGQPGQPIKDPPQGVMADTTFRGDIFSVTPLAFAVVDPDDITLNLTIGVGTSLASLTYTLA